MPKLVQTTCLIDDKHLRGVSEFLKQKRHDKGESLPPLPSKELFKGMNSKSQLLAKTFLANLIKLLRQHCDDLDMAQA